MIQTSFFLQPEKDKPLEIIPIPNSIYQPRKVEELSGADVPPDTYIIYPEGGYHPFYGVPNTPPRYQQKIWPYVKRIKYSEQYKSRKLLDNVRKANIGKNHTTSQVNLFMNKDYMYCGLLKPDYTTPTKLTFHRLVAQAFIPNPEGKPLVMHINDDVTNYLIENLKWGTHGENAKGKIFRRPGTVEQKYLSLVNRGIIKG